MRKGWAGESGLHHLDQELVVAVMTGSGYNTLSLVQC